VRAVIVVLAVLAGLKIWSHDQLYRSAATEALLNAYRAHAVAACQSRPQTDVRGMPIAVGNMDWKAATGAEVLMGNPNVQVPLWQVDHALWNTRYKHPVVRLTVGDRFSVIACDYDVIAAAATLRTL
jgi:hypothetical protein